MLAIYYGEVYLQFSPVPWLRGAKGVITVFERTGWGEQSRPIDVTGTTRRLFRHRLAKLEPELLVLTPAGVAIVEDTCIVSP